MAARSDRSESRSCGALRHSDYLSPLRLMEEGFPRHGHEEWGIAVQSFTQGVHRFWLQGGVHSDGPGSDHSWYLPAEVHEGGLDKDRVVGENGCVTCRPIL